MAKAKKNKKERPEKYDPKLKIDGSFDDVIDLSLDYTQPKKEEPQQKSKKKKN